jgi:hypothetical protein
MQYINKHETREEALTGVRRASPRQGLCLRSGLMKQEHGSVVRVFFYYSLLSRGFQNVQHVLGVMDLPIAGQHTKTADTHVTHGLGPGVMGKGSSTGRWPTTDSDYFGHCLQAFWG